MPEVPKIDEFAFILLGGVLMIIILMVLWSTPTEPLPTFEPKSAQFTISQGSSRSFDIEFKIAASGVNLTAIGIIKDWMTFDKNYFDAVEGTKAKITIKVPDSKPEGTYSGRVEVKSKGGISYVGVNIEVTERSEEVISRPVFPGDFTVSYSRGEEILDSKSTATVSKSYFGGSGLMMTGSMTTDRLAIVTEAYVQIDIGETNGAGDLIVLVNGEAVYSKVTSVGTLIIPINKSLLKTSNIVEIQAGTPGWKFWMSTAYRLNSANFGIKYEGIFSKRFDFSLSSLEIANFKNLGLTYRVQDYSLPLSELMIKVNNQLVFWERPPFLFGDHIFVKDVFGNNLALNEGNNTISFNFEKEASYTVADTILTVNYYG